MKKKRLVTKEERELWLYTVKEAPLGCFKKAVQQSESSQQIRVKKISTVTALNKKLIRNFDIENRLDLHGFTKKEAFEALGFFLKNNFSRNIRRLLIITGKGREGEGILNKSVPMWLESFNSIVIGFANASIKDGGSGAFYVLLRKHKSCG